jgi:segregation and condensation protein B
MDRESQKQIVEALILAAPEPVTAAQLADVVPRLKPAQARELIAELGNEYDEQGRAFEIWEVAGGYQIRTRPSFAPYLRQLLKERPARLSRAALETLSVIAYKQPVTRAEVELVRGVDVGAVLRSLVDRKLIRIAGHREVPGRPMLYATSRRFLEVFGLSKLDDLPTLREIEDLVPGEDEEPEETSAAPSQATAAPVVESSSELH